MILWAAAANAAMSHQQAPPLLSGVAGFDVYRDGNLVHLLTAEFDDANKSRALLYRQSQDDGVSWSRPIRVNDGRPTVYDIVRGNDPQIAARGSQIVAVWTAHGSGYAGSGPLTTAVSQDGGKTWRRGPNPADDASTAGHAYIDLVASRDGFDLVWLDARDGVQGLRHARSRDGFAAWTRNVTVQRATCECCWNSLVRSDDAVFVLLRGKSPRDMLLAERARDGKWRRLSTVGDFGWDYQGCPHTGGGLAWSRTGRSADTLHAVVWTGATAAEGLHYLHSTDRGRTWSSPHAVGSNHARRADIAATEDGRVLIAWDQLEGHTRAVYAMQSQEGGRRWLKPVRLSMPDADAVYPRVVAVDTKFLVAWTEQEKGRPALLKMEIVAGRRDARMGYDALSGADLARSGR